MMTKGPQYGGKGPYMLPKDHSAGTNVPPGGASCKNCIFLSKDETSCGNAFFIRWNGGSPELPAPADSYCSDWWEHATGVMNDEQGAGVGPDGKPLDPNAQAAGGAGADPSKPDANAPGEPGHTPLDPNAVKRAFGNRDEAGGAAGAQLDPNDPNAPAKVAPGGPVAGKGQLPPPPDGAHAELPDQESSSPASKLADKYGGKKKKKNVPPMPNPPPMA